MYGKWPRHYAADICRLKTPQARRAALDACPPQWRELIARYVVIHFERKKHASTHGSI